MWRQTLTVVNRYRSKTTLVSSWVGKVRYLSANNNKFPIPDSFFNEELENLKELEDAASAVMLNGGIENLASLHERTTIEDFGVKSSSPACSEVISNFRKDSNDDNIFNRKKEWKRIPFELTEEDFKHATEADESDVEFEDVLPMYGSRSSKTTVLSDMYRLEKSLIGSNVKGRRYYGPNSGSEEVQVTEQDVADIELEDLREENFSEFNEAVSDASAPLIEETEDKRDIMDPSFFFDDKEISKYGNRPGLRHCPGHRQRRGVKGRLYCHKIDITELNPLDVANLRRFLTEDGEILKRSQTGLCSKCQNRMAKSVKQARHLGVLPHLGQFVILDNGSRDNTPFHRDLRMDQE